MTEEQIRQIIMADEERFQQAGWLALQESGPYPGDGAPNIDVRRWVNKVNKLHKQILKRLN